MRFGRRRSTRQFAVRRLVGIPLAACCAILSLTSCGAAHQSRPRTSPAQRTGRSHDVSVPIQYDKSCRPAAEGACNGPDLLTATRHGSTILVLWAREYVGPSSGIYYRFVEQATGKPDGPQRRVPTATLGRLGSLVAAYSKQANGFVVLWQTTPDRVGSRIAYSRINGAVVRQTGRVASLLASIEPRDDYLRSLTSDPRAGTTVLTSAPPPSMVDSDRGEIILSKVSALSGASVMWRWTYTAEHGGQALPATAIATDGAADTVWSIDAAGVAGRSPVVSRHISRNGHVGGSVMLGRADAVTTAPDITALAGGGYLADWTSVGTDGQDDIWASGLSRSGQPLGAQQLIGRAVALGEAPEVQAYGGGKAIVLYSVHGSLIGQQLSAGGATIGNRWSVTLPATFEAATVYLSSLARGPAVVVVGTEPRNGHAAEIVAFSATR
jgi:hypothetical protein